MSLWGWDENGNRKLFREKYKPFLYVESKKDKDAISIYNTPLKKIEFPSESERRRYVKNSGIRRIFHNLKPEMQYLLDRFGGMNTEKAIDYDFRMFILDIEVYADAFPNPDEARYPINLITIYDSLDDFYYTLGLDNDYTPTKSNLKYIKCNTEVELLEEFLRIWGKDFPDLVVGWNSSGFDIPYIINRLNNVLGEEAAKKLSPINSIWSRETENKFKKTIIQWTIDGVASIDLMDAYKNFSINDRESYSLNYISEYELKEGKVAYNSSSLTNLADSDWNLFVEYNIQDVELVKKLEDKLQYLKICRILAYKGFCGLESTLGKIAMITGAIANSAQKRGMIIGTFVHDPGSRYMGGFVKEIEPGILTGLATFDANSLYPNTLITLNLSPETKIGKVLNIDRDKNLVEVRLVNGKIAQLTVDNFKKFIIKENIAVSSAKVMYSQKKKGIIPEYSDSLYEERVHIRNEMSKTKDKEKKNQLDIMQYTIKILLNSIYGVFGNKYSPFYDVDNAESITHTGQAVIKNAGQIASDYIQEKYDVEENSFVYGDTDSVFLSLTPLANKLGFEFAKDGKISEEAYEKAFELRGIINEGINKWAVDKLNSVDPRFFFKKEKMAPTGAFQSKKRYILHVLDVGDDKPKPIDEIKYTGVDVVKSTMSNEVKDLIKELINSILRIYDKEKATEIYRKCYLKFKELSVEQFSFRVNLSEYSKWEKKATGYRTGKGTPAHAQAAYLYNTLLKNHNLDHKYDTIGPAQKIKWFYTEVGNNYGIDKIAFIQDYPKEFHAFLKPDYEKMFKKLITPQCERMYECCKWKLPDITNEYRCSLIDMIRED